MVDRIVSKDSAKKANKSSVKNHQDEIIKDDYVRSILNATNQLPMKIVRTDQYMMEFLKD